MSDDLKQNLRGSCYLAFEDGTNDYETAPEAADRIEALEAKLVVAVEALEFYADADNYEDQHKRESCGCCYYLQDAEIKEDEGVKARATLAAVSETYKLKGEQL